MTNDGGDDRVKGVGEFLDRAFRTWYWRADVKSAEEKFTSFFLWEVEVCIGVFNFGEKEIMYGSLIRMSRLFKYGS